MATNMIVTDGTTGGINTNVVRVISQTSETSDSVVNAEANKGYILTGVTLQTVNLPTPCAVGDVFALHGKGAGLFHVAQRAGEGLVIGNKQTTVGVTGFVESTNEGDAIYFLCDDSAGLWRADSGYVGSFSIDGVLPAPVETQYGFVQMVHNLWSGRDLDLLSTFQEVIPTGASYFSDTTSEFTNPSNLILKYVGVDTKIFLARASVSSSSTHDYALAFAVNGVVLTSSENYFDNGKELVIQFPVTLTQNDEVSMYMLRSFNVTVEVDAIQFYIS